VWERQRRRRDQAWSTSDGRWEIYLAQKAAYEPPEEVAASERTLVDTSRPLADQLAAVAGALTDSPADSA
jgi:hypothetical protein